MKRFITAVLLLLLSAGCIFAPKTDPRKQSDFHSPVDTPAKLMENFQLAYETKNFAEYSNCLHEEFEFMLLEQDWDDYNNDGVIDESWGRDIEEAFTEKMFDSPEAEFIELLLEGTAETPWYGDPSGATVQMVRNFELKVYFLQSGQQEGCRATGSAVFLVKADENGEYRIWNWIDQSEV